MLLPFRASEVNSWPYEQTAETLAFERRIREGHPTIRVRRWCEGPTLFAVFVFNRYGKIYELFRCPALSDRTVAELDRMAREARKSREESFREAEKAHEAEQKRIDKEIDTWTPEQEEIIDRVAWEATRHTDPRFANDPEMGRHTNHEVDNNIFVKKFDDATGTFDDGFQPVEWAQEG